MLTFVRNNIGVIMAMLLLGGLILGGIYYVETSLAGQVQEVK